jgi:hypothetical protein
MNKITIGKDVNFDISDDVEIMVNKANKFLNVKEIKIKIINDADLEIECLDSDLKLDIYINVLDNVKANIYELKNGEDYKCQYKYYLGEDSFLRVEKVIDVKTINEMSVINLNGERSKIDFYLKTISKMKEKYNFLVYHNANNTVSHIINNGVNILEGTLEFNVSSFVSNGTINCDINQSGRIINNTNNTCLIKPNLFIDENDVMASHSALIGTFSFEEIFYLMSRGISKKEAESLLTKGFLLKNITHYKANLEEIINKYWR